MSLHDIQIPCELISLVALSHSTKVLQTATSVFSWYGSTEHSGLSAQGTCCSILPKAFSGSLWKKEVKFLGLLTVEFVLALQTLPLSEQLSCHGVFCISVEWVLWTTRIKNKKKPQKKNKQQKNPSKTSATFMIPEQASYTT